MCRFWSLFDDFLSNLRRTGKVLECVPEKCWADWFPSARWIRCERSRLAGIVLMDRRKSECSDILERAFGGVGPGLKLGFPN